jgi:hypothetical protein
MMTRSKFRTASPSHSTQAVGLAKPYLKKRHVLVVGNVVQYTAADCSSDACTSTGTRQGSNQHHPS